MRTSTSRRATSKASATSTGSTIPEQLRASLEKSRRWGFDFDQAWMRATRNAENSSEPGHRHQWQVLFASPEYQDIWRQAYERRSPNVTILEPTKDAHTEQRPARYDAARLA